MWQKQLNALLLHHSISEFKLGFEKEWDVLCGGMNATLKFAIVSILA